MNLHEQIARWEAQLSKLRTRPQRWGECRRFAGRTAGIRLDRIAWLTSHISDANDRMRRLQTECQNRTA